MDASLSSLINLYMFPSGRRLFASRGVKAAAEKLGERKVAELADEAIAHEQGTMQLNLEWSRRAAESSASTEARDLACWGSLYTVIHQR